MLRRLLVLALFIVGNPTPKSLLIGLAILALGQLVHLVAAGTLVKTDVLTIAGPYRFVRNPFYVGSFLTDVGFCVIAWNPWVPLVWFPLFYLGVIHPRTLAEEAELLRIHGQAYQDYLNRVPRYIPSPFPRYPHVRGSFSRASLLKNREISRQIRHFCFAVMFFAKGRMIQLQGGKLWSVEGAPKLIYDNAGRIALAAGFVMIFGPWAVKLAGRLKKRLGPPPRAAEAGSPS